MSDDLYRTLNLSKNASSDEIRKAYRKLAMKYHPDRNNGDAKFVERFKEIQKAYDVLSNPQKKSAYDRHGNASFQNSRPGGGATASAAEDIFGSFFSGFEDVFGASQRSSQGFHRTPRKTRGEDLLYHAKLTLEEAAFGCEKSFFIETYQGCTTCKSTGQTPGTKVEKCGQCKGTGQVTYQESFFVVQQTCPKCRGEGMRIASPCRICVGKGRVSKKKKLSVAIPPGIDENDRIRLAGEGHAGANGGVCGDLYIDPKIEKHEFFARKKDDLYIEVPVSFPTAALGSSIDIPSLGGGKLKLRIPQGTQSGSLFRLKGKGIQNSHNSTLGDLMCRVHVEIPVNLMAEQKEYIKKLQGSFDSVGSKNSPECRSWLGKVKTFLTGKG